MANIYGTTDDDILDRQLYGTSSDDNLYGYTGLNWFNSSLGSDTFFGGPGKDLIFYSNETGPVSIHNTTIEQDSLAVYTVQKSGGALIHLIVSSDFTRPHLTIIFFSICSLLVIFF